MKRVAGFTLIELVVAITIMGIAASTLFAFMSVMGSRSAEAQLAEQAGAIANAYIQEITSKSFAVRPGTGQRRNFDDVLDYNGLNNNGARDQLGNVIAGLNNYRVQVAVANFNLAGIPAGQSRRIIVTVTDPANQAIQVTTFVASP